MNGGTVQRSVGGYRALVVTLVLGLSPRVLAAAGARGGVGGPEAASEQAPPAERSSPPSAEEPPVVGGPARETPARETKAPSDAPGAEQVPDLGAIDLDELGLEAELELMAEEEVTLSASRRPQRLAESPSTITVITREQILASGLRDVHDLLRLVPGFDVHLATVAWPMIGARAGSTEASDLMVVLVDGRELATQVFGIPLLTALSVPIESIERIEVIRGPGSTLYGSNAYQGVVNIITRQPGEATRVYGVLRAGTQSSYSAWVGADAHLGPVRLSPSFGIEEAGSFFPGGKPRRVGRARLRAVARPTEVSSVDAEAGVSFLQGPAYTGLGAQDIQTYLAPYLRLDWRSGGFEASAFLNVFSMRSALDLGLRLVGSDGSLTELARLRTVDGVNVLSLEEQTAEVSAHYRFEWSVGEWLSSVAVAGVALRGTRLVTDAVASSCPDPFTTSAECTSEPTHEGRAGVYLQNESQLGRTLLLTLGLRLDLNSIQADPLTASPRANLVWQPFEGHALRLGYGRAYRKPTLLEARAHLRVEGSDEVPEEVARRIEEIFATQIGNESLRPEILEALELGYRGHFLSDRLVVTADLWAYRAHDSISFNVDLLDTFLGVPTIKSDAVLAFQNEETSEYFAGFEVGATHRPLSWLGWGVTYGLRHAFQSAVFSPTHSLDLFVRAGRADGPRGWLGLDWLSSYTSTVRDPRSSVVDPIEQTLGNRARLNLSLAWRWTGAGGTNLETGILATDLLSGLSGLGGVPQREFAGCAGEGCPAGYDGYVGEPLGREVALYLRGAY